MGLFSRKADEVVGEQTQAAQQAPPDNIGYAGGYSSPFSNVTDQIPLGMGGIPEKDISKEVAEYLTSNQAQIKILEAKLRGQKIKEEYDATTGAIKTIVEDCGEPLMNELGIQRYVGYMENMISKNSVMANIKEHFLSDFMIEENQLITSHLLCNQEKYLIKDTDIQQIISLGENFIYICLTRGLDRGESILLLKGRRENITRYVDDAANRAIMNQRQSIWSAFSNNQQR